MRVHTFMNIYEVHVEKILI